MSKGDIYGRRRRTLVKPRDVLEEGSGERMAPPNLGIYSGDGTTFRAHVTPAVRSRPVGLVDGRPPVVIGTATDTLAGCVRGSTLVRRLWPSIVRLPTDDVRVQFSADNQAANPPCHIKPFVFGLSSSRLPQRLSTFVDRCSRAAVPLFPYRFRGVVWDLHARV